MHRVGYHRIELNVYTQLQKRWFLNCMIHERCDPRALWEMFAQLRNQCFPFSIIYEKSFFSYENSFLSGKLGWLPSFSTCNFLWLTRTSVPIKPFVLVVHCKRFSRFNDFAIGCVQLLHVCNASHPCLCVKLEMSNANC